jgi:1,4-alpha-glucan branching enzyme
MDEQGLLPKGKVFKAEKKNCDNREFSFAYPLEAYGVGIFTY